MAIHVAAADSPLIEGKTSLQTVIDPVLGLVVVRGELDREQSPWLLEAISGLAGGAHPAWLIDAADVTFCDAGGLRALATAAVMADSHGRRLRITASSRCVRRLVTLAGLSHLLLPPAPAQPRAAIPRLAAPSSPAAVRSQAPPEARPGAHLDSRPAAPAGAAATDDSSFVVAVDYRLGRLQLIGRLDRRNAHLLHDTIYTLLLSDCVEWTADVAALAIADHVGIKAIGTVYRRLLRNGRRMTLSGVSPALEEELNRSIVGRPAIDRGRHPRAVLPSTASARSA